MLACARLPQVYPLLEAWRAWLVEEGLRCDFVNELNETAANKVARDQQVQKVVSNRLDFMLQAWGKACVAMDP
eukprot:7526252-Lingulodinium_polyedra.AAC.1